MSKVTLGLSSIEVGAIAVDGGMGTTLAPLGKTYENSCTLATEDPTTTEFYSEEDDDPVASIAKKGKTTLSFQIMDPDLDTLVAVFGGTKDTVSTPNKWKAPANIPVIEKSLEITPQVGLVFQFPRVKLTAKMNSQFSKSGLFLIDVVATVLVPEKTGEPSMMAFEKPEA